MHDHKAVYKKTKCILERIMAWAVRRDQPDCHEVDVLTQDINYVLRDINEELEKEDEKD